MTREVVRREVPEATANGTINWSARCGIAPGVGARKLQKRIHHLVWRAVPRSSLVCPGPRNPHARPRPPRPETESWPGPPHPPHAHRPRHHTRRPARRSWTRARCRSATARGSRATTDAPRSDAAPACRINATGTGRHPRDLDEDLPAPLREEAPTLRLHAGPHADSGQCTGNSTSLEVVGGGLQGTWVPPVTVTRDAPLAMANGIRIACRTRETEPAVPMSKSYLPAGSSAGVNISTCEPSDAPSTSAPQICANAFTAVRCWALESRNLAPRRGCSEYAPACRRSHPRRARIEVPVLRLHLGPHRSQSRHSTPNAAKLPHCSLEPCHTAAS